MTINTHRCKWPPRSARRRRARDGAHARWPARARRALCAHADRARHTDLLAASASRRRGPSRRDVVPAGAAAVEDPRRPCTTPSGGRGHAIQTAARGCRAHEGLAPAGSRPYQSSASTAAEGAPRSQAARRGTKRRGVRRARARARTAKRARRRATRRGRGARRGSRGAVQAPCLCRLLRKRKARKWSRKARAARASFPRGRRRDGAAIKASGHRGDAAVEKRRAAAARVAAAAVVVPGGVVPGARRVCPCVWLPRRRGCSSIGPDRATRPGQRRSAALALKRDGAAKTAQRLVRRRLARRRVAFCGKPWRNARSAPWRCRTRSEPNARAGSDEAKRRDDRIAREAAAGAAAAAAAAEEARLARLKREKAVRAAPSRRRRSGPETARSQVDTPCRPSQPSSVGRTRAWRRPPPSAARGGGARRRRGRGRAHRGRAPGD